MSAESSHSSASGPSSRSSTGRMVSTYAFIAAMTSFDIRKGMSNRSLQFARLPTHPVSSW